MARKKGKGTKLKVFSGREASLNRAIFQTLATEGPQTILNLQKQVSKQKGLRGTYYASVSKRVRCLEEAGYIKQVTAKPTKAAVYELRVKAYLAALLDSFSIEDLLTMLTDSSASLILSALLKSISLEKSN